MVANNRAIDLKHRPVPVSRHGVTALCVCVCVCVRGGGDGGGCWLGMYNIVAPELSTIFSSPRPFVFLLSFFFLVVQDFVAVVFCFLFFVCLNSLKKKK